MRLILTRCYNTYYMEKLVKHDNGQWDLQDTDNRVPEINSKLVLLAKSISIAVEELEKMASKKQLAQMIPDSMAPHHQEAINHIRTLFPNSMHDVWLTKEYRNNPSVLKEHAADLDHISKQMKAHNDLRLHDVSKMGFKEGLQSLLDKDKELTATAASTSKLWDPSQEPDTHEMEVGDKTGFLGIGGYKSKSKTGKKWFNMSRSGNKDFGAVAGHCGNGDHNPDSNNQLHYLASEVAKDGETHHKPHVTIINAGGYLGEMKGNFNKKPNEEDHEDIMDYLAHPDVKGIIGGGFLPHQNFSVQDLTSEQQKRLKKMRPHIDTLDTDEKLDPKRFPAEHADAINGHNSAVTTMNNFGHNMEDVVKAYKKDRVYHGDMASIVAHPKFYTKLNKEHLEGILNHALKGIENEDDE